MSRLLAAGLLLCACGPSPGRSCSSDAVCGEELVCLKPAGAANGICSFPFAGPGARCLSNGDCAPSLFCSNDLSTGTRQFAGACQAVQGQGASCYRNANCGPPLVCRDAVDGGLGTCR
jgi:hypothetical protein